MENYNCYFQLLIEKLFGKSLSLTHISLASFLWDITKQLGPRPEQHFAVSDQGLHFLLFKYSIKIEIKHPTSRFFSVPTTNA